MFFLYSFVSPYLRHFLLQKTYGFEPGLLILIPQIHSKWQQLTYTDYFCHAFLEQDTSKTVDWEIFSSFQVIYKCFNQSAILVFFLTFLSADFLPPPPLNGLKPLKKIKSFVEAPLSQMDSSKCKSRQTLNSKKSARHIPYPVIFRVLWRVF